MKRIATRIAAVAFVLGVTFIIPAHANDPGQDAWMYRVLSCKGPDAKMEVYLPQSIVLGNTPVAQALTQPVIGYYTLDLTEYGKGKPLEPVKVSMTADGKAVVIDQYTRGLPVTRIPIAGGTVNFDQRFGTKAKCGPFQYHE